MIVERGRWRGPDRRAHAARRRPDRDRRLATARSRSTTCRSSSRRSPSSFATVLRWSDELRELGCPRQRRHARRTPRKAIELGAEGIGLCRTEHMFLGERQPLMVAVILADGDEAAARGDRPPAPAAGGRLRADPAGRRRTAADGAPARPAAARVPAPPRRAAGGLGRAPPRRTAAGDQPDARHARRAARDPAPGALRNAGRGAVRGRRPRRRAATSR